MRLRYTPLDSSAGFTIIELMIATTVFAIVLLILVVGVLSISNSYYKGITQSQTQNYTRTALNQLSQAIQFGSANGINTTPTASTCTGATCGFCLGDQYFQYELGVEQISAAAPVLATQTQANCAVTGNPLSTPVNPSSLISLLGVHMRLTSLVVTKPASTTGIYEVTIAVAYGDNDLLCNTDPGLNNVCSLPAPNNPLSTAFVNTSSGEVECRLQIGERFCATASLGTTVQQRFSSN